MFLWKVEILLSAVFVITFRSISTMISGTKGKSYMKINLYFKKSICFNNTIIFTAFFKILIWLTNHLQIDNLLNFSFTWLGRSTVWNDFNWILGIFLLWYTSLMEKSGHDCSQMTSQHKFIFRAQYQNMCNYCLQFVLFLCFMIFQSLYAFCQSFRNFLS